MPTPQEIASEQERLYESSALRDDLNDAEATILLEWGQNYLPKLADQYPDEFEQKARFFRQLLKNINRFVGQREFNDRAGQEDYLSKVIKYLEPLGWDTLTMEDFFAAIPDNKHDMSGTLVAILRLLGGETDTPASKPDVPSFAAQSASDAPTHSDSADTAAEHIPPSTAAAAIADTPPHTTPESAPQIQPEILEDHDDFDWHWHDNPAAHSSEDVIEPVASEESADIAAEHMPLPPMQAAAIADTPPHTTPAAIPQIQPEILDDHDDLNWHDLPDSADAPTPTDDWLPDPPASPQAASFNQVMNTMTGDIAALTENMMNYLRQSADQTDTTEGETHTDDSEDRI